VRGGISKALIPHENVKDLAEIPDTIKGRIEIVPVKWIDEVLENALASQPVPLPDTVEPPAEAASASVPAVTAPPVRH
jgi:ATP-dependent Lon protease